MKKKYSAEKCPSSWPTVRAQRGSDRGTTQLLTMLLCSIFLLCSTFLFVGNVAAECIACMELHSDLVPGRKVEWVSKKCMAKQKDIELDYAEENPAEDSLCPGCFHERKDHTKHRHPYKRINGRKVVEVDLGRMSPDGTPLDEPAVQEARKKEIEKHVQPVMVPEEQPLGKLPFPLPLPNSYKPSSKKPLTPVHKHHPIRPLPKTQKLRPAKPLPTSGWFDSFLDFFRELF